MLIVDEALQFWFMLVPNTLWWYLLVLLWTYLGFPVVFPSIVVVLAVSEIVFIIYSGPDVDEGKIDGPGTRGNGPRGSRGPGKTTTIWPNHINNMYYL